MSMCKKASIKSKAQNNKLLTSGAFGNRLLYWRTFDEYWHSPHRGLVVLREAGRNRAASGRVAYGLTRPQAAALHVAWCLADPPSAPGIYVNEAAPDHLVILQGELFWGVDRPWHLLYSTALLPMRPALRTEQRTADGLASWTILKGVMSPSSWEDLLALEPRYPEHVVELSVYRVSVGDIPGRNTLVWEIRQY